MQDLHEKSSPANGRQIFARSHPPACPLPCLLQHLSCSLFHCSPCVCTCVCVRVWFETLWHKQGRKNSLPHCQKHKSLRVFAGLSLLPLVALDCMCVYMHLSLLLCVCMCVFVCVCVYTRARACTPFMCLTLDI